MSKMFDNIYEALRSSDDYLFRLLREVYLRGVEDGSAAATADDPNYIFHDWASIELALENPCYDPEDFVDANFSQGKELD